MTTDDRLTMEQLAGTNFGTRVTNFTMRDALLYNLTVGAPATDLTLSYERDASVLPTYGCAIGLWAVEACGDLGAYDRFKSLHASQQLRVLGPLNPGDVEMRGAVRAVWDKGSAAVVEIDVESTAFVATYTIFVPGAGGWGGDRGPSSVKPEPTAPTWTDTFAVPDNWAALYRLTGDLHPVHIDPEAAHAMSLDRPILHGLCTLGIAARAAAAAVGASPHNLESLSLRLAAPVYPGDELTLSGAADGSAVQLDVTTPADTVLSGTASYRPD